MTVLPDAEDRTIVYVRIYLCGQNTRTWWTDGQTDLPWLLQRSALRAMQTAVKTRAETCIFVLHLCSCFVVIGAL